MPFFFFVPRREAWLCKASPAAAGSQPERCAPPVDEGSQDFRPKKFAEPVAVSSTESR